MHSSAATWSIGESSDPAAEQTQQDRTNALGLPLSKGSRSKRSRYRASSKQLYKSFSTPQLRGSIMSDPDIDKKRNRLGYQRITIACAHCRRRKIRCILPDDEAEHRCSNCIRLKKDCVFYPVDQQTALDAQSETSSKTRVPSTASSTVSSSPPHLSTRTLGQHQGSHQNLRLDAQGMRGVPIAPSISPAPPGSYSAQNPQGQAYLPRQGQDLQAWEGHSNPGSHHHLAQAPMGNVASMHPTYPVYNNPALRADTVPFPDSTEINQAHPAYVESVMYGHPPTRVAQQWQQQQQQPQVQQQPTFYLQHQQHGTYHPSVQRDHQPAGYYPHRPEANVATMPLSSGPPSFQHSQQLQHPHYAMQPGQPSHLPAGHYLPTQQVPDHWQQGPAPFNPGGNGTDARYPSSYSGPG